MNTGESHGSALGADEVAATKKILGFDPDKNFEVTDEVIGAHPQVAASAAARRTRRGTSDFDAWAAREPERKALFDRLTAGHLPARVGRDELPSWEPDGKGVATRKASGEVLAAFGPVLPELWGGSADLAGSNNTTMTGADSFGPTSIATKDWNAQPVRPDAALRRPRARDGARSSTASPCTAPPAPTAAPSCSSPTTCGPRFGSPR